MKAVSLTILFIAALLVLSTGPGTQYFWSEAGNLYMQRVDKFMWILTGWGWHSHTPPPILSCSRVDCSWCSINICWITKWVNAPGMAKGQSDNAPILTPLLTNSSRSWLHFRCWHCYLGICGPTSSQDGHPCLAMTYLLGYQGCRGGPWNLSLALEAPANLAPADLSGFIT